MDKKPKVLITGFAPFGAVKTNPSWQVTRTIRKDNIYHVCLPVEIDLAPRLLLHEIKRIKPRWVFGCGVHFGRDFLIETRACRLYKVANANQMREGLRLPWPARETMVDIMVKLDKIHPTMGSNSAGRWLCEHVAFWIARLAKHYRYEGGFIHCPMLSIAPAKTQRRWWRKFLKTITEG